MSTLRCARHFKESIFKDFRRLSNCGPQSLHTVHVETPLAALILFFLQSASPRLIPTNQLHILIKNSPHHVLVNHDRRSHTNRTSPVVHTGYSSGILRQQAAFNNGLSLLFPSTPSTPALIARRISHKPRARTASRPSTMTAFVPAAVLRPSRSTGLTGGPVWKPRCPLQRVHVAREPRENQRALLRGGPGNIVASVKSSTGIKLFACDMVRFDALFLTHRNIRR